MKQAQVLPDFRYDATNVRRPEADRPEPSDDRPDRPTDAHRPVVVATDLHHAARLDVTFHSDDNRPRCPCRPRSPRTPAVHVAYISRGSGVSSPRADPTSWKTCLPPSSEEGPNDRERAPWAPSCPPRGVARPHRPGEHAERRAGIFGGDASRVLLSVRSSGGRGHGRDLAEWFQDRCGPARHRCPTGQHAVRHRGGRGLQRLVGDGARFVPDRAVRFDDRFRRMLYGYTSDGRSIAEQMVLSGNAYAIAEGVEQGRLRRAQVLAERSGRGCLWRETPLDDQRAIGP